MLKYKELLGRELNIGDVVLLKRYYDGGLLLNVITKERNEIDLYLYNKGQDWGTTLCYKLEDNSILNSLQNYDYKKNLKFYYKNFQYGIPMFDMLNRKLNIGDLVIYNILETGKIKFGIINSENTVLTDSGRSKKVNMVLLLENLTDYEKEIKTSLSNLGMRNLKINIKNTPVDLKNNNLNKGDIFGATEDTCFYIYIGKSYYNVYNKVLNKNYPSDELDLVLKIFKNRKEGKLLSKYLEDNNNTIIFRNLFKQWGSDNVLPFYLSEQEFNEVSRYSDNIFRYITYSRKDSLYYMGIDYFYEGLKEISETKFKKKRDLKVFGNIPINNTNIVMHEEKNLKYELVIL